MKSELIDLYNKVDIRNVDLKIDPSVNEICKISNQTSSITRNVLYFILVAFLMCLIIIINTAPKTWALRKKEILHEKSVIISNKIDSVNNLINLNNNVLYVIDDTESEQKKDSVKFNINKLLKEVRLLKNDSSHIEHEAESLVNKYIPEFRYPNFPILGITFDVNDTGIIMGLLFLVLLLILFFTKRRENINTKIAFKAISERYRNENNLSIDWTKADESLKPIFKTIRELNKEIILNTITNIKNEDRKNINTDEEDELESSNRIVINCIIMQKYNYCCRKHHYNFLTTNEIFNIPRISILSVLNKNDNLNPTRILLYIINCLPFIAYISIVYNDLETIERVYASYPDLISNLLLIEGALTVFIFVLCIGICYLSYNLKKYGIRFMIIILHLLIN